MRSRYSAFVLRDVSYLLRSWHPRTRPRSLELDTDIRWLGLEVLSSTDGGPFGAEGTVEFRALHTHNGRQGELREKSRFVRHEGAWVYLDGAVADGT